MKSGSRVAPLRADCVFDFRYRAFVIRFYCCDEIDIRFDVYRIIYSFNSRSCRVPSQPDSQPASTHTHTSSKLTKLMATMGRERNRLVKVLHHFIDNNQSIRIVQCGIGRLSIPSNSICLFRFWLPLCPHSQNEKRVRGDSIHVRNVFDYVKAHFSTSLIATATAVASDGVVAAAAIGLYSIEHVRRQRRHCAQFSSNACNNNENK